MSNERLRFDELQMLSAICSVREKMRAAGEEPGSDRWLMENALELTKRVNAEMIDQPDENIVKLWHKTRKAGSIDENGMKKHEIIVQHVRQGHCRCFYEGKVPDECSDEVELDRIKPGSAGGEYTFANTVLACRNHNNLRRNTPFDDFLNRVES